MTRSETLADGYVLVEGPRPDGHGGVLFSDAVGGGVRRWTPARWSSSCRIVAASAASSCTPTAAPSWAVATSRTATGRCSSARPASAASTTSRPPTTAACWPAPCAFARWPASRPSPAGDPVARPARRGRRKAARIVAGGILWPNGIRPVARGRRALRQRLRGGRGPRLRPRRRGPPRPGAHPPDLPTAWPSTPKRQRLGRPRTRRPDRAAGCRQRPNALLDVPAAFVASVAFDGRTCSSRRRVRCCARAPALPGARSRSRPSERRPTTRSGCPRSAAGRVGVPSRPRPPRCPRGPGAPPRGR